MWIAWVIVVAAGLAAGYVYWRMRPLIKALGPNFLDANPRFQRHELEKVRGHFEHGTALQKHKQLTALDLWFAPLVTVAVAALVWGITYWHSLGWLPLTIAIIAGVADQVENVVIRRILATPHRPVPQAEATVLASATSVKFAGYVLAVLAALTIVAFIR
jgi:hypothetical protein